MLKAVFIFLTLVIIGYLAAAFFNPDLNRQVSAMLPSFIVERAKNIFGRSDEAANNRNETKPFVLLDEENKNGGGENDNDKSGKERPFYAPVYLPIKEKMESLPEVAASAGQVAEEVSDFVSRKVKSLPETISEGVSAVKEKAKEKITEKAMERLVEGLDEKKKETLQKIICSPAPQGE